MKLQKLVIFLSFLCMTLASAQTSKDALYTQFNSNWSFGIGFNVIGDSGDGLDIDTGNTAKWNYANPLQLKADYFFNPRFSLASTLSFNSYKVGKIIDGKTVMAGHEASYVAFDVAGLYSFRHVLKSKVIDPYLGLGTGYAHIGSYQVQGNTETIQIPKDGRITGNLAVGLNLWFSKHWGLNFNATGKFGISSGTTNQHQYSMGLVYLLSKKEGTDSEDDTGITDPDYERLIKENYKKKD